MKNEFTLAFNEVLEEKQLPKEIILKALESAMVSAYRRAVNASNAQHVEAKVDPDTGKVLVFAEKEVVESVEDERTEVELSVARKVAPEAELGDMVVVETTPADFGRVAAQTARQVIQQRIREAERAAQMVHYEKLVGEVANGVVQAVNAAGVTIGLDMKAEGVMNRKEMIPGERFHVHDRVRALIYEVKDGSRGPQILLSRGHRNFLRRLLENEVPEIFHGVVEIRSIAREPGERAKVAVSATQQGIDPVGACVGIRGVRIQAIVRELHDEKIDVIEWNTDPAVYIAKAISPARVSGVYLNERASGGKTATVVVPEDQLSLAIGRDGQNARLAAKLTGWRIDIKSVPEAATETLERVRGDAHVAEVANMSEDMLSEVSAILEKKADNRPLTPEEFDTLTQFVDKIEKRSANRRQAEKKAEEQRVNEARETVPSVAFEMPLDETDLPQSVYALVVSLPNMTTVGDLMLQMKLDRSALEAVDGMTSKAMAEIEKVLGAIQFEAPEPEQKPEVPVAVEPAAEPVVEAVVEPVVETPVEPEPEVEQVVEAATETTETPEEEELEEMPTSIDALFAAMKPEVIDGKPAASEEEEEFEGGARDKSGKKKKKKSVEVVYDPDRDMTVTRKKHKRGGDEWDWE
jgi:N utilization substance protein A